MRLTRRDAVRALVAGGIVGGGTLAVSEVTVEGSPGTDSAVTETDIETMKAVAEVVYPSEVEVSPEFVETYVDPLDETRKARLSRTIDQLNTHAKTQAGAPFYEIRRRADRESVLHSLGVSRVQSSPEGSLPSRVKYHLVNSLLYALFTTPKGSELFGIRNPTGYGGGFATYRKQIDDE